MPADPKTILLNVILAHSGEAAIQQVYSNSEISLILMDINLGPGIE